MFQVIPAIDLINGQVVRLTQGDYAQKAIYSEDPAQTAKQFAEAGAKWIHLVDLDGAKAGAPRNLEAVRNIRKAVNCNLELGGGIRTIADAEAAFKAGADRVILGSIALKNKELTLEFLDKFGPDKIVLGIDAKDGNVAAEGWLETSTVTVTQLVEAFEHSGFTTVIYTDISRDGMLQGPNLRAYQDLCARTHLDIIASGGVSAAKDLHDLRNIPGLAGVIVGKAIYENRITLQELFSA